METRNQSIVVSGESGAGKVSIGIREGGKVEFVSFIILSFIVKSMRRKRTLITVRKEWRKSPRWCGLPFKHHSYHGL